MVLTLLQNTEFFAEAAQMGINVLTRAQLDVEGVANADDLSDWDDDDWDQFSSSCKCPGQILDINNNFINQAPFILTVGNLKHLKEASNISRYYNYIGQGLTTANMRYQVISNFQVQRKAIEARLKEHTPDVPRLTKVYTVPQWADSFCVFLSKCPSAQGCATMAYVSRTVEAVANPAPLLHVNQPHSDEHSSVAKEYEHRLSHADAYYGNDNEVIYG